MDREIGDKFRVWDDVEEKMIYFNLIDYKTIESFVNYEGKFYSKLTFMRPTGLKDKNGKEIWEGDVVRIDIKKHPMCEFPVGYVFFKEGAFYHTYGDRPSKYLHGDCEVIGDIYSTPDLIEKGVDNEGN